MHCGSWVIAWERCRSRYSLGSLCSPSSPPFYKRQVQKCLNDYLSFKGLGINLHIPFQTPCAHP